MYDYSKKPEKWMIPKYFEGSLRTSRKAYNRAARKLFKQLADYDLYLAYQLQHFLNYERIGEGTLYELQNYFYQDAVQADRLAKVMQTYDNEILMPTIGVDCDLDRYYFGFDM